MKALIIMLLIVLSLPGLAQTFKINYEQFQQALTKEDYNDCIEKGNQLLQMVRYPSILYKVAECYCQADSVNKSLGLLQELAGKGLPYDITSNLKLDKLKGTTAYGSLVEQFARNAKPVLGSENAFVLDDVRMIPEGLTATADGKRFFISSLAQRKIVAYENNRQKDFILPGQNRIWMVLGMKISADGKSIWVCSASENARHNGYSGIFGFDLNTGRLIKKYVLDNKSTEHLFNDLVIAPNNTIYFTDSKAGKVYKLSLTEGHITPLVAHDFIYPNGIAFDEKRNMLYVADRTGITSIDLQTNALTALTTVEPGFLNYIDGLYFYNHSLIGIQGTGSDKDRIVRLYLNESGQQVARIQVLESFHPDYVEPTTGAIVNNEFYFIAISQVSQLQPDGTILNPGQLRKPLIKKIRLD
ncbi:hypothetical protein A4H97_31395 [Niastella yeongjuensis]|uniref:SMP-30/Gluconolactonase/LRE-like region domain-containing protein n=1 Tax=Niastella yeongjuensis TaxID=354355 RepID=A0A1V9EJF9_9BACT|nr:SMP-30/gluconolactonase/LRE family protein [Niastella yeongjuensis]OQP46267.1 hypothetical protein A4H97_31395 [Niastella yeongjuensis]SEP46288.1 SMP-30/Gluconolaconase/LRE-like region-containing protein [Niastella yeongjuensis]